METCFSYSKQTVSKIVPKLVNEKIFCQKCYHKVTIKGRVEVDLLEIQQVKVELLQLQLLLETWMKIDQVIQAMIII